MSGFADLFPDEIPVGSLLRENTCVLEIHRLDIECQIVFIMDLPAFRQMMLCPVAAAGVGADITGIITLPFGSGTGGIPDDLRIRADQNLVPPTFQTFTGSGIQNLIFFPSIGNPKHLGLLLISYFVVNRHQDRDTALHQVCRLPDSRNSDIRSRYRQYEPGIADTERYSRDNTHRIRSNFRRLPDKHNRQ